MYLFIYLENLQTVASLAEMTPKHCNFQVGPANAHFHCGVNKQMMHLSKKTTGSFNRKVRFPGQCNC